MLSPADAPKLLSSPGPFYLVAGVLEDCVLGPRITVCAWSLRHQNGTRIYRIPVDGQADPGVYTGPSGPWCLEWPGNGGEATLLGEGGW